RRKDKRDKEVNSLFLKQRDLRGVIGGPVFERTGVDHGVSVLFEGLREERADGVAIGVVRKHDPDLLVVGDLVPQRKIQSRELGAAEGEVVRPLERRRLARLPPATEIPSFPWHYGRKARHARRLAGVSHRIHHLGGRGNEHKIDLIVTDEGLGQLASSRRVRLRIPIEQYDLVALVADPQTLIERLAYLSGQVSITDTERSQVARAW